MGGKLDARLTSPESQEIARQSLAGIARPADIGDFAGAVMEGERLASLAFECLAPGYVGWFWLVTLSRLSRSRTVTVCETELLPSDTALLSPAWVAWSDRLRPGDLGPGDVLPFAPDDPRLEQGYEATGDDEGDQLAIYELGLGRARVLSRTGRHEAAERWYAGDGGPNTPIAQRAKAHCSTCGFLLPMPGALRAAFGVCANEWSPSDGRVVSLDHGCGAHSETDVKAQPSLWPDARVATGKDFAASVSDVELVAIEFPEKPADKAPAAAAAPEPDAAPSPEAESEVAPPADAVPSTEAEPEAAQPEAESPADAAPALDPEAAPEPAPESISGPSEPVEPV